MDITTGTYFAGYAPFHSANCNGCNQRIFGTKYECHSCQNFTLCLQCHEDCNYGNENSTHEYDHLMKRVMSDLQRAAIRSLTKCDQCSSDLNLTDAYDCHVCSLQLCHDCFDAKAYTSIENHRCSPNQHKMQPSPFKEPQNHSYKEWKAKSIQMQNEFGRQLGSRSYDSIDDTYIGHIDLGKKIGFAIYGSPMFDAEDKSNMSVYGYTEKQEEHINKLRSRVIDIANSSNSRKIQVNFIFVSIWNTEMETMLPIIRVNSTSGPQFIETTGRTYSNWDDFMENNHLPKCDICTPSGGIYRPNQDGYCVLQIGKSAACRLTRIVTGVADKVATAVGIGGLALGVVGLFTPFAPAALTSILATSSVYGLGRSAATLHDRASHQESINPLADRDAFYNWLSVAGSVAMVGSMSSVKYASSLAYSGNTMSRGMNALVNTTVFANLGVNAIGLGANAFNIIEKSKNEEEISKLEIFQFCASALFFANSAMNVQKAETIFKNAQKMRMNADRNDLTTGQRRAEYDRLANKDLQKATNRGESEMVANQKTIQRTNNMRHGKNWQKQFDNSQTNSNSHKAFQRHAGEVEFYSVGNGKNLGAVPNEKSAIDKSINAHNTRNGGRTAHVPSTNTVLPESAMQEVGKMAKKVGDGTITLNGEYYAQETNIVPSMNQVNTNTKSVKVTNPSFGVKNGKVNHFIGAEKTETCSRPVPPKVNTPMNLAALKIHECDKEDDIINSRKRCTRKKKRRKPHQKLSKTVSQKRD